MLKYICKQQQSGNSTFGAKPSGSGHSVQICIGVLWHVIVEHNIHSLDIHTTPKQVSGHEYSLAEILQQHTPTTLYWHGTVRYTENLTKFILIPRKYTIHKACHTYIQYPSIASSV